MPTDPHLLILCEEYIEAVDLYRLDVTADGVSALRTSAHDTLLDCLRLTRADKADWYAYARNVVYEARQAV